MYMVNNNIGACTRHLKNACNMLAS